MNWFITLAIYFAIPLLATIIAGRRYTWRGHVLFFLLWPVLWIFVNEELP